MEQVSLPWTPRCSDSELVQRLQPEIERFGRVLKWVHRLEPIFIFVPINKVSGFNTSRVRRYS